MAVSGFFSPFFSISIAAMATPPTERALREMVTVFPALPSAPMGRTARVAKGPSSSFLPFFFARLLAPSR